MNLSFGRPSLLSVAFLGMSFSVSIRLFDQGCDIEVIEGCEGPDDFQDNAVTVVDLATSNTKGFSPMTEAAQFGQVEYLADLYNKSDVNLSDSDDNGHSPATVAAQFGQVKVLTYLHDQAAVDLAMSDAEGLSPAIVAAQFGQLEVLAYLHEKVAIDLARVSVTGSSPSGTAARYGQVKVLEYLHDKADVDLAVSNGKGHSPATRAAHYGHVNALAFLRDRAAVNLSKSNGNGLSPATVAAQFGHVEVLAYLHDNVTVDLALSDTEGLSPATAAAQFGQLKVLEYLHQKVSVDVTASNAIGQSPATKAASNGRVKVLAYLHDKAAINLTASNANGFSPATEAACAGELEVLAYLHDKIDLAASSTNGFSPATMAAYYGKVKILEYLHDRAAVDLAVSDAQGFSPTITAARAGQADTLAYLHDKADVDLTASCRKGFSPAASAARFGQLEVLEYLHHKAAVDLAHTYNADGHSPATVAARFGQSEVLAYLHDKAAVDLALSSANGSSPATVAARFGHVRVLCYLHEKVAGGLASSDDMGWSPATKASNFNQVIVLDFLMKRDVNLHLVDANGKTPEAIATRTNHMASLLFLSSKGLLRTDVWLLIRRRAASALLVDRAMLADDLAVAARSKLYIDEIIQYLSKLAMESNNITVSRPAIDGLASCVEGSKSENIMDESLRILVDKSGDPDVNIQASAFRGLASATARKLAREKVIQAMQNRLPEIVQVGIARGYSGACLGRGNKTYLGHKRAKKLLEWNRLCRRGGSCMARCLRSLIFTPLSELTARLKEVSLCSLLHPNARRVAQYMMGELDQERTSRAELALRSASYAKLVAHQAKAMEEKQKQEVESAKSRVEKQTQLALNMSINASKLVAYDSKEMTFIIPQGVMTRRSGGALEAHRCPNVNACPGNSSENQCAQGYDNSSAGCSRCLLGYGRKSSEPFSCVSCPDPHWTYILATAPVIPFTLGMLGARQSGTGSAYSSYLKLFMSYCSAARLVINILQQTQAYVDLKANMAIEIRSTLRMTEKTVTTFSGVGAFSHDCLLHKQKLTGNFILDALLIDSSMPLLLLFFSLVIAAWFSLRSWGSELKWFIWPFLVFTNAFTPSLFVALLRVFPCIHTQLHGQAVLAYDLYSTCTAWRLPWTALAMILCVCLVPLSWHILLSRSQSWEHSDRTETTGFVTKEFQGEYFEWQIFVLLRTIVLNGIAAAIPVSYATHTHVILLQVTLFAALMAHLLYQPYNRPAMNHFETLSLSTTILALISMMLLVSTPWSQTDETLQMILVFITALVTSVFLLLLAAVCIAFIRRDNAPACRS